MNTIHCRKYQEELEALEKPPFPNALGQKIQQTISKRAWQEWQDLQTMLINEKQLSLQNTEAKTFLNEQREKFFDNTDYEKAEGFTPKK